MRSKFAISILVAALAFACDGKKRNDLLLPVYGPKRVEAGDTIYHKVGSFALTNQHGEKVTAETVRGKIRVSNFFFASCQSICPEMSTNLTAVQDSFMTDPDILILSHSVNPMHDTVEVLARYAAMYGARKDKWHLLTGVKKQIYDLAKESYLVSALEDDGSPEGFLHSELLILVDRQDRIRGMYDGTDKVEVNKLVAAIRLLKKEESRERLPLKD